MTRRLYTSVVRVRKPSEIAAQKRAIRARQAKRIAASYDDWMERNGYANAEEFWAEKVEEAKRVFRQPTLGDRLTNVIGDIEDRWVVLRRGSSSRVLNEEDRLPWFQTRIADAVDFVEDNWNRFRGRT